MRKRLGYGMAVMATLLIVALAYNPAMAADYNNVGVKVGDKAVYQVKIASGAYNKSIIQVYGILAPKVYLNYTRYKPDGSVYSTGWLNRSIATVANYMYYYLIAGGLSVGDNFTSDSGVINSINITKTQTMTAAGASRSVNYVNGTISFFPLYFHDCYYDKETGLLVKGDIRYLGSWDNRSLISTTAWSPSGLFGLDTTTLLIISGIALVLIVAIVLALRRRK